MVSNREDLQSDCKTVNAIVSALTIQSAPGSTEEFGDNPRRRSSASKINFMSCSPTLSPPHVLPRPRSENNFFIAAAMAAAAVGAPEGSPLHVGPGQASVLRKPDNIQQKTIH